MIKGLLLCIEGLRERSRVSSRARRRTSEQAFKSGEQNSTGAVTGADTQRVGAAGAYIPTMDQSDAVRV
eukprot:7355232-Pyramimonas_sp.AAC.1